MANVIVKGKHKTLAKEEIRAIIQASATVLEFHNKSLYGGRNTITVELKHKSRMGKNHMTGGRNGGIAWWKQKLIWISNDMNFDKTLTVGLHEVIHLYYRIDEDHGEWATDTLTNRLKPWVIKIYENLIDGVYKRAGFMAHVKISYYPEGMDEYNDESWQVLPVNNVSGKKLRKKKNKAITI
jgi:hypothetical protein